jgi:O-antigen/teichoic acid export membrane protein
MRRTARAAIGHLFGAGEPAEARAAGGRRIAGAIGLQMTARILGIASGMLTLPLLARTLGTDGYGIWAAGLGYVGLFTGFSDLGLANASMQMMAKDPEHEGEWLAALSSLRTVLSLVAALICIAFIPLAFGTSGDAPLVALVLVITVFTAGAGVLLSVFRSRLRMGIPLVLLIVQSVLWIATVVILALTDASVVAVACAYAGVLSVVAVLQVVTTRRNVPIVWQRAREHWGPLLKLALPIGLGGIFITIYWQIDAVLLFKIGGAHEAGIYGVAYRFLDPLVYLPSAVMGAFLPVVAAHHGRDDERVRGFVQRCIDLMAIIGLPGLAITLVLSPQIINLFAGPDFARSAEVLPILMGAFAVICYGYLAGFIAPVLGLQWRIATYAGAGAVANVLLNLVLIPKYGAVGSAVATLVTETLSMSLLLGTSLRRLHLRPSVLRPLGTVVAAAAMTGVLLLVEPLGLVPALAIGTLAYAAALALTRTVTLSELRALREAR